jgi:hypothetical protein
MCVYLFSVIQYFISIVLLRDYDFIDVDCWKWDWAVIE